MTTNTNPAKDSIFGRTFPLLADHDAPDYSWTDSVVTQGHADYCALYGHASWIIDGISQGRCPRCGDLTPTDDPDRHAERYTDPEPLDYTDQRDLDVADSGVN